MIGCGEMTSNPSIFEKAIAGSHDYDEEIRALVLEGKDVNTIYETLRPAGRAERC